jgi:hypothetical protein
MKRHDFIIKSSIASLTLAAVPNIFSQSSKITKLQVGNPLRSTIRESLIFNSADVEI